MSRPIGLLLLKYSDFATNVIDRSSISGRKMESITDRWFDAMIAPPEAGTCSAPSTRGRHSVRRKGPATALVNR